MVTTSNCFPGVTMVATTTSCNGVTRVTTWTYCTCPCVSLVLLFLQHRRLLHWWCHGYDINVLHWWIHGYNTKVCFTGVVMVAALTYCHGVVIVTTSMCVSNFATTSCDSLLLPSFQYQRAFHCSCHGNNINVFRTGVTMAIIVLRWIHNQRVIHLCCYSYHRIVCYTCVSMVTTPSCVAIGMLW